MQQKLSLFFVSWVALSRTCNPKLRVSLVCFSSCASVCHGKCWHGMFPLSHSFACSAEVSVPCVSVVYFSSVSVAWQCCSSWSFLHLVLIMWGPLDFHLIVFLWGHCSSLYNREALGAAAVCKCSLQSSVQPWEWVHIMSYLLLFPLLVLPKAARVPWEHWNVGEAELKGSKKRCWEKQPQKEQCFSCTIKITKEAVWNTYSYMDVLQNPSIFK